jgi:cobaltochelatase CobS
MASFTTAGNKLDSKVAEALLEQMRSRTPEQEAMAQVEPTPEPEPEAPKPVMVVGEGQKALSDIIKSPPFDFAVTILPTSTLHPKVASLVPNIDPLYRPDVDALAKLLYAFEHNDTALLSGPTGCGKSQLVRHACALTGRPLIRINMTGDAESSVIFGTLVARSGSTAWEDGPATEAWRYGAVLNVDEYDVTPPEVAMGFQWMLENDGRLFLKEMPGSAMDKIIMPHANARLVMCGNTVGQGDETGHYAGVSPQNTAFVDRFRVAIRMNYLPANEEKAIIKAAVKGIPATAVTLMVQFAWLCRQAYQQRTLNLTMSPRTLLNWGSKIQAFGLRPALDTAYLDKLTDSQRKIALESFQKVFGTQS